MTNKTNTFPKLTAAQERAWQMVLDWHKKHGKVYAGFTPAGHSNFGINIAGVFGITETEATIKALAKRGMLVSVGKGLVPKAPWMECYTIHPDYIPTAAPAPEPAPAAAPAPVNNAPEFMLGDEVYLVGNPQKRIVGTVNNDGTYGLRTMSGGTGWTDYTADQLTPARDASIPFADMNAYERIIIAAAETNARLEARIKELETELADLRGDMERLAAREMELLQQNTLLDSLVGNLCERAATVETAAQNAVEAYGKQDAEYTMRVLAHLVGIEWN